MSAPISKMNPTWLSKQSEFDKTLNKNYIRSIRYYKKLFLAWPDWIAEDQRFKQIYNECKARRKLGELINVDHIVPICSDIVCGLHVPWNLQIISEIENNKKSNKWWPNHPFENLDLFGDLNG